MCLPTADSKLSYGTAALPHLIPIHLRIKLMIIPQMSCSLMIKRGLILDQPTQRPLLMLANIWFRIHSHLLYPHYFRQEDCQLTHFLQIFHIPPPCRETKRQ